MQFNRFFNKILRPRQKQSSSAGTWHIPDHVAIIMDGNGRWGKRRGLPRQLGHRAGATNLKRITEACCKLGVRYLTVYAFSTENWKRSAEEVNALFALFIEFFHKYDAELMAQDIRLRFIGDIPELPVEVRETIYREEKNAAERKGMQLIIAFNYGGRREIWQAASSLAEKVQNGDVKLDELKEEDFKAFMYQPDVPDPDLLIRTSGELRLSNFLLWQLAYSEIYVTPKLWPDFNEADLKEAIASFQGRERKFGGIKS